MLKLILKGLVILVVAILVAFASAAVVIPAKKTFTQETPIDASRETVWKVLTERDKYPEWQEKVKKIEVKDEKNWTEFTENTDPIVFTETSREENVGMRISYSMGEFFKGTWVGEIRRIGPNKSIIRTTDTSQVNSVVMKIAMAMFFDIEDFAKDWNQSLKKRAEEVEGASTGK
ncbi:MAG: hypothetical protein HKN33_09285 [Pyrinomonadaceae bacterium]|nr:hypothetical protein [Pyrinomonadaceae bacterium]